MKNETFWQKLRYIYIKDVLCSKVKPQKSDPMKTENYFVRSGVSQRIANANGKYSTQFMSGNLTNENLSIKKNVEESVRMGGYELKVKKPTASRTDTQQPMGKYSEFWIC